MRKLFMFWLASLIVVAGLASALTAQVTRSTRIISGSDLGFRVEGTDRSGRPFGTLVVQVNGQWIDVVRNTRAEPALIP
jgi:hypothetical protein